MAYEVAERICLGSNGKNLTLVFNTDLRKANQAAQEFASESGIEYNTSVAQDLISGGIRTEARLNEMVQSAIDNAVLPPQKHEIMEYKKKALKKLSAAVMQCKRLVSPDYGLSSRMFYVEADGNIKLADEGIEALEDAERLYIDKPEQIEIYNDCKDIMEAIERLQDKTAKFGMTATSGGRAVLAFSPDGSLYVNPHNIADCYTGNFFQRSREESGAKMKAGSGSDSAKNAYR